MAVFFLHIGLVKFNCGISTSVILLPINLRRLDQSSWHKHQVTKISLSLSDAYVLHKTMTILAQIMVCRLFGAKPLSGPMTTYCQLDIFQWNLNQNAIIFTDENDIKNVVCKLAAFLSWPWCVMSLMDIPFEIFIQRGKRVLNNAQATRIHSRTERSCCPTNGMMTSSNGNIFPVTGPLWGEPTGHRWIPLTKASDAELWCFLWSAPEQTFEQIIETLVIWDAIALIMTSLWRYIIPNMARHVRII